MMQEQFEKLLQKQCPWHPGAKHSAIKCYNLRKMFNAPPLDKNAKKKGKGGDKPEDKSGVAQFQNASKTVNIIFGGESGFASKQAQKLTLREILSIEPALPRPLQWSEVPISFSRDDHWTSFSEVEKFPLVLDPVVASVRLTRVLIDGGSSLNLLFTSTLKNMRLDITDMLTPSKALFYGIVPGTRLHHSGP
jgi:hypothetical protein